MKILASTSIRSDYDLMSGVYKALARVDEIDIRLLVSGAHLADTYGYTITEIRRDNVPILAEIETLIDSNSRASRAKTASLLLQNTLHTVEAFKPDLLLFAGDREDTLVFASIGAYLRIPTLHFFGGDHAADGNVDNPVRHAVSKLATAHFVTNEIHRQRLLRMGEPPSRIFVVGNPALDRFRSEPPLTKEEILTLAGVQSFRERRGYAVMVYHPLLGQEDAGPVEVETILRVLVTKGIPTFVNNPNTDAGSRSIMRVYETFAGHPKLHFFRNFQRNLFVNLLRHADFLVGNSSLGLIEAPSIPLGVINVGKRQRGRAAPENVVFVDAESSAIASAIDQVRSSEFLRRLQAVRNPYGDGYSVDRAVNLIRTLDFKGMLYKCEDPLEIPYP